MQEPFDLGAPPAELPDGSTNLPEWLPDQPQTVEPMEIPVHVEEILANWAPQLSQCAPEMQEAIKAWLPKVMYKHSVYTGVYVTTLPELIAHVQAAIKAESKLARQKTEYDAEHAARYAAWAKECQDRNTWIELKNTEWRRRVAARKAAIDQWDAYVEEARHAYQDAKAYPPPPRPVR